MEQGKLDEIQIVWEHFKFNADQRMRAFHFFIILSIFIDGGLFASLQTGTSTLLLRVQSVFVILLSIVFFAADQRSQHLLSLSAKHLTEYEKSFRYDSAKLFTQDANSGLRFRYRYAIRTLLLAQFLFGFAVLVCPNLLVN